MQPRPGETHLKDTLHFILLSKISILALLQPDMRTGATPLMLAAGEASDETVSFLLSMGASPNKMNANGNTALIFAIQSKCVTTINMLIPVTDVELGKALSAIAFDKLELKTGELKQLVDRAVQDREMTIDGLFIAAHYGSSDLITLIGKYTTDHSIFEIDRTRIWMEAIYTDSALCGYPLY